MKGYLLFCFFALKISKIVQTIVTFSPDGKFLVCGSLDASIFLLDATTGEKKKELEEQGLATTNISFSPDGSTLVSRSANETVLVWDFASILETINTKN